MLCVKSEMLNNDSGGKELVFTTMDERLATMVSALTTKDYYLSTY